MADPQVLIDRAKHLTALRESPSYPVLRDILQARVNTETQRLVRTPIAEQQGLDWGRGFIYGLQTVLLTIEGGEKMLERAIATARRIEGEQEEA